jgi:nucleoside-diphosphate-sugar epimerase
MATLVTGGTGFVASNIVKELARTGHQVVCYDLVAPGPLVEHFVSEHAASITFVQGDILDPAAVGRLASDYTIDRIVHAAVYTVNDPVLETERSKAIVDINFNGTLNLLELARNAGVDRFLYVSSGSSYGTAGSDDQTLNEATPTVPSNLYSITKYASELITRRYGELYDLSTASVRLSTPYGPMERVTGHRAIMSVPYQWTRQALRGEAVEIHDPNEGRDFTYVTDIARGIRTILDAPDLPHGLYNLTSGVWITFRQIGAALKELSPSTNVVEVTPSGPATQTVGPARGPLSGHRLYQDLGWTPLYDIRSGLEDYLRWRRDSGFLD